MQTHNFYIHLQVILRKHTLPRDDLIVNSMYCLQYGRLLAEILCSCSRIHNDRYIKCNTYSHTFLPLSTITIIYDSFNIICRKQIIQTWWKFNGIYDPVCRCPSDECWILRLQLALEWEHTSQLKCVLFFLMLNVCANNLWIWKKTNFLTNIFTCECVVILWLRFDSFCRLKFGTNRTVINS